MMAQEKLRGRRERERSKGKGKDMRVRRYLKRRGTVRRTKKKNKRKP